MSVGAFRIVHGTDALTVAETPAGSLI